MKGYTKEKELFRVLDICKLLKDVYFEGGFVLSSIYKIDRIYSGDLDFTIECSAIEDKLIKILPKVIEEFSKAHKQDFNFSWRDNSIEILQNGLNFLTLDYYIVPQELFEWKRNTINVQSELFEMNFHTVKDILAEKICCVIDKDRYEFKDLWDIKEIEKRYIGDVNGKEFYNILARKMSSKNIEKFPDKISKAKYYESFKSSHYRRVVNDVKFTRIFKGAIKFYKYISNNIKCEES